MKAQDLKVARWSLNRDQKRRIGGRFVPRDHGEAWPMAIDQGRQAWTAESSRRMCPLIL